CTVKSVPAAVHTSATPTTMPAETAAAAVAACATEPATSFMTKTSECTRQRTINWQYALNWVLAATKIIAFAAGGFLFLLQTVAGHLSLVGPAVRGIRQIISSVCWAAVLLAMLTPWQQLLRPSHVCGATFNLGDIVHCRDIATGAGFAVLIPYYTRFIAYPCIAILAWLMIVVKFARGYYRLTGPQPAATVNMATKCDEVK
ncbi:MAG TPA: hypothetical protein PLK08_03000, partial [Phycisphaerae bacterium]|nr:hypothetical protein [Phycisphaerae bacterium]